MSGQEIDRVFFFKKKMLPLKVHRKDILEVIMLVLLRPNLDKVDIELHHGHLLASSVE